MDEVSFKLVCGFRAVVLLISNSLPCGNSLLGWWLVDSPHQSTTSVLAGRSGNKANSLINTVRRERSRSGLLRLELVANASGLARTKPGNHLLLRQ